jgi:hypothetical protein
MRECADNDEAGVVDAYRSISTVSGALLISAMTGDYLSAYPSPESIWICARQDEVLARRPRRYVGPRRGRLTPSREHEARCAPIGALPRRDSQLAIPQRHRCITRHTRRCRPVQMHQRTHAGHFLARIVRRTASSKGGAPRLRVSGPVPGSRMSASRRSTACANRSAAVRCANGSASGSCVLGLPTGFSSLAWLKSRGLCGEKKRRRNLSGRLSRLA